MGTPQIQRHTKACVSRTRNTSLSEGRRGHGAADQGAEGPEYSVPEEAELLTEWMMPCRA